MLDITANVSRVYSTNWPMRVLWEPSPSVIFGGPFFYEKGTQEKGPQKIYLNFFVQSIQKQLKKVWNMNAQTNKEEEGN